jgi:hypothetical protein
MKKSELDLLTLEKEYDKIKLLLGQEIGKLRVNAGFPKRTYTNVQGKSANILFKTEQGKNFPNLDTLKFYFDLYDVRERDRAKLLELHEIGSELKKIIIGKKRGRL